MQFSTAIPHCNTHWKPGKSGLEKATQVIESAQLIISIGSHDDTAAVHLGLVPGSSCCGKPMAFPVQNDMVGFREFSTSILAYWMVIINNFFVLKNHAIPDEWIWCTEALWLT